MFGYSKKKGMLGNDSGIISQLPSPPHCSARAKCFEYAHHISRNKNRRPDTSTTAQTTFFGAYCLRFHLLSCLQLALKLGPKQECQRSPADHIHSNRKQITNILNMALKTLCMHLSEKFCSLSSDRRNSASRQAHLRI
jgi:hypothetical protein